jgi:hypothetical protein
LLKRDQNGDRRASVAIEQKMFLAVAYDTGRHDVDDVGIREVGLDRPAWLDFENIRKGVQDVVVPVREAEKLLDQRFELLPRTAKGDLSG